MLFPSIDRAFRRFQASGDPSALARVFDGAAPRLRGLAAHLASPEASAEDLLQTTFLTAIESKHRYDASQPLLPWLAGILANHARDARRRQRREFDPQRLQQGSVESPVESAASTELRAELDRSIASLPEQYRSVLRLYLENGLEPAEIARSLERPPGTVRAQLSRGLEKLRRRLPSSVMISQGFAFVSVNQLAALRARLLVQVGGTPTSLTTSTLLLGFLTMSLNKKIVAGCAVLLIALLSNRIWSTISPETSPDAAAATVERVEPIAAANDELLASRESRTEVALPIEVNPKPPSEALRKTTSLVVHVQDSTGLPLPNIGVVMRTSRDVQDFAALLDFRPTDASGSVTFDDVPGPDVTLQIDRNAAFARTRLKRDEQNEATIQIAGMQVQGSVVDQRGQPVGDATIWAHGERLEAVPIAMTDTRGEFHLDHISPNVVLQARHAGFAPSRAYPALGKDGEIWSVSMGLDSAAREVSGRVLDPSGVPVADALVAFVPQAGKVFAPFEQNQPQARGLQLHTSGDGTFHTSEVPQCAVVVNAVGRDSRWTPAGAMLESGSAPERVELLLRVGATLEGTITDAGKPQRGCSISIFCSQPDMPVNYLFNLLGVRSATTDKQGKFRVVGIVPGQVEMHARRNGNEILGEQTISLTAGQVSEWDLDCSASPGSPFEIAVEPKSSPSRQWHVLVMSADASDEVFTVYPAESGPVQIKRLKQGRYTATVLYSPEPGDALALFSQEFDAHEQRLTLRIPEERLHFQSVRGKLTDASGAALPSRALQVHGLELGSVAVLQRSTDANGNFSVAALAPGRYRIEVKEGGTTKILREFTLAGDRAEDLLGVVVP